MRTVSRYTGCHQESRNRNKCNISGYSCCFHTDTEHAHRIWFSWAQICTEAFKMCVCVCVCVCVF